MMRSACGSSVPITTRLGRRKSSIAEPSRRNSGLETTAKWPFPPVPSRTMLEISWPVPIGTVLLVTITL